MAASTLPRGLILDLVTPLRQSGEVDEPGLHRLLDRVLPHIQGLWLASPYGGEGEELDGDQRAELLGKSLAWVRGKVPLFVWVTRGSPHSTLDTLRRLQEHVRTSRYPGQVFWVDTPLYYQSNRGLPKYYQGMASLYDREWVLHNDPKFIQRLARPFKRNNIRTSILKDLSGIEGIRGLIFSGPLDRAYNYQKATRARAHFRLYDGEEPRFLSHPSLSGVISVGANLAPKAWQKITRATLNLDSEGEEYPDRLRQTLETGEYLRSLMDAYGQSPAPLIKTVLSEMGVIESPACKEKVEGLEQRMENLRALLKGRQE
ncbi:MAG: dihydrodipicolinate synthase family protein [Thermodesulfobacteriota bacterium]